ncbi:MAG: PEP-CTERM sorting domain-containing protein [Deltaproteobacteria bacterium]|nr:PEP-CTERM sorting domain-containing protein [Deltaproteobacteria bacterium]
MRTAFKCKTTWLLATLAWAWSIPLQANLISNGGFESGFSGWTRVDQVGGDGTFLLQTGTLSPVNSFPVPAPPEGLQAAMTDSLGPGSHVLYQDFVVPADVAVATIGYSLFINNGNGSPDFFTPAHLDFATPALNQQARADIITTLADPFSVAALDVLQNLFQTNPGDPLVSGYNALQFDITALLQAHPGETLRLRFAEVDNVAPFNMGVDGIDLNVTPIPEPSSWILTISALLGLGLLRRSRDWLSLVINYFPAQK